MKNTGVLSAELSRRSVLHGATCAAAAAPLLGAVATTFPSPAEAKSSQESVAYQPGPKGSQRCDNCTLWQPPNACKTVDGQVEPSGWCKIYIPKKA